MILKQILIRAHRGGVFQDVKNDDLLVTHGHNLNTNCEIVWIQCKIQVQRSFTVGTYYNPNENVSNLEELDASLLEIGQGINSHNVILTRDFNISNIDRVITLFHLPLSPLLGNWWNYLRNIVFNRWCEKPSGILTVDSIQPGNPKSFWSYVKMKPEPAWSTQSTGLMWRGPQSVSFTKWDVKTCFFPLFNKCWSNKYWYWLNSPISKWLFVIKW